VTAGDVTHGSERGAEVVDSLLAGAPETVDPELIRKNQLDVGCVQPLGQNEVDRVVDLGPGVLDEPFVFFAAREDPVGAVFGEDREGLVVAGPEERRAGVGGVVPANKFRLFLKWKSDGQAPVPGGLERRFKPFGPGEVRVVVQVDFVVSGNDRVVALFEACRDDAEGVKARGFSPVYGSLDQ